MGGDAVTAAEMEEELVVSSAEQKWAAGKKFRVVKEGARLEGIVTFGDSAWAGYSKALQVGDEITCNGWRIGMDGQTEEANFTADGVPWNALWIQFWPMSGLFRPWPMEGYLEEI